MLSYSVNKLERLGQYDKFKIVFYLNNNILTKVVSLQHLDLKKRCPGLNS